MAGQRSVSTRVDAIEHQLQHVQALANATAKGFGKDKVQRQWVVFAQGEFRARLEEAWGVWKEGAGKVRSEGGVAGSAGSADKPQPFKVQVFGLVREQLGRQGLAEDVCQGLAGLRAEDVVESLQVREPPEDVSKPWSWLCSFVLRGLDFRPASCSGHRRWGKWWASRAAPTRLWGCDQADSSRVNCSGRSWKTWDTGRRTSGPGFRAKVVARGGQADLDRLSVRLVLGCLSQRSGTRNAEWLDLFSLVHEYSST